MERIVARCELAGRPVVEPRHCDLIRVRVGEAVVLRFVYHVHERSRKEDHWRFTLEASCGDDVQVDEREHRDHFLVQDHLESSLACRFIFEEEGKREVRFVASAQMRSTPWVDDTMRATVQADVARGTVSVQVTP